MSSLAHAVVHWKFLLIVTLIAVVGVFIGASISRKIDGKKLKPAFGWFVLIMGIYIIVKKSG
ncbi:TSUP family transporter [Chitinophaga sp. CF418]|uniref:TSUP family transporter n=1 Tax=Chitinophaga sp. CF418 TaxID=1855287 RepID=UPI00122C5E91